KRVKSSLYIKTVSFFTCKSSAFMRKTPFFNIISLLIFCSIDSVLTFSFFVIGREVSLFSLLLHAIMVTIENQTKHNFPILFIVYFSYSYFELYINLGLYPCKCK